MLVKKESLKIGDRVKHVRTGSPGTVVSAPSAPSALDAPMVRVRWDSGTTRCRQIMVSHLERG